MACAIRPFSIKENQTADDSTVWWNDWNYSLVLTRASAVDNKTAISR